ncbi:MAG: hypothetical protein ABJF23_03100 [Bryobacteraceae bacterium]
MKNSHVRVLASRQVAILESGGSRAEFTVLIVADQGQEDRTIRGVRIEFSDAGWTRAAYLDEIHLQPLKDIVDRLTVDLDLLPASLVNGRNEGYLGSCEFRDHSADYPVQFDYCYSGGCAQSLRFLSPTGILFLQRKPSDLSAILGKAIDYLQVN